MRAALLLVFGLATVLGSPGPAHAQSVDADGGIPDLIYDDPGSPPTFVAGSESFELRGVVSIEEHSRLLRWTVEKLFELYGVPATTECVPVPTQEPIHLRRFARADFRASERGPLGQIEAADWLVLGRVRATRVGFWGGQLGTLLLLEETGGEWESLDRGGPAYVFVPSARLTVGSRRLCLAHERFARVPRVGEEVLLLLDERFSQIRRKILRPLGAQVILLPADGRAVVSPDFLVTEVRVEPGDLSVAEVLQQTRRTIAGRARAARAGLP